MAETSIRFRTQADIAPLREYTAALREYRQEVEAVASAQRQTGGGGSAGAGAPAGGAPVAGPPPPSVAPQAPEAPPPPPSGGDGGGNQRPGGGGGGAGLGSMVSPVARGGRALGQAAAGIAAIGLGAGIVGFGLNAAQKYWELSKAIAVVNQRFQEGGRGAASWGQSLAYTIGQTAAFVEVLGEASNAVSKATTTRFLGFARERGVDTQQVAHTVGSMSRLTGRDVGDRQLAAAIGDATARGMGQGRLGEYLETLSRYTEETFRRTGSASFESSFGAGRVPGMVFGAGDERGKGAAGMEFMQSLSSVITNNPAMQVFMMRSMGYGQEGGPGYIEMRKRMEAGVFGEEGLKNLTQMASGFQQRGFGSVDIFRALEGVSGGQLPAHQLEALSKFLASPTSLAGLQDAMSTEGGLQAYRGTLGEKERALFDEAGFSELGKRGAGAGDWRTVQMEAMQMAVGAPVSEAIMDLTSVVQSVFSTLKTIAGVDFGTLLTDITGTLKKIAQGIDRATGTSGLQGLNEAQNALVGAGMRELGVEQPHVENLWTLASLPGGQTAINFYEQIGALPPGSYDQYARPGGKQ